MLKIIFMDRDGVINKDPGGWTKYNYVTEPNEFHFLPGALKALKLLHANRIRVVIISNQAGVSKGCFTKDMLSRVNSKMCDEIGKAGGAIDDVYYCIHKDEDNCACRKPKTGMLEKALAKYRLNPKNTFMVGDSKVDVMAGRGAGIKTIFVLSGKATAEDMKKWEVKPDYCFGGLLEAVEWILNKEKRRANRSVGRKKLAHKDRASGAQDLEAGEGVQ